MTDVDVPFTPLERAVYVDPADALVVADLHLGRAAASNVDAPLPDGEDALERLASLLERTGPATVVVAGDLLHSFSEVPRGVERTVAALRGTVEDAGAALVVTPGNHDAMLERVFDGETSPAYRLADGETVVLHGHESPGENAEPEPTTDPGGVERYVIGHDHPALSVEGRKVPCFLYGPEAYDGADVLQLPAFTRLAPGSTVNGMSGRDFASPLVRVADRFHPAVRDADADETLWFPPLGECRRVL